MSGRVRVEGVVVKRVLARFLQIKHVVDLNSTK